MNCFEHRSEPAIGICRHCGRALCPACAAGEGRRLLCATPCRQEAAAAEAASITRVEAVVGELHRQLEQSRVQRARVLRASSRTYSAGAYAAGLLAVAAGVGGFLAYGSLRATLWAVAAVFALVTILRVLQARNWSRAVGEPSAGPGETKA